VEGFELAFDLPKRSKQWTKSEALAYLYAYLEGADISWIEMGTKSWIFDFDQMKQQVPEISGARWLSGKMNVEPEVYDTYHPEVRHSLSGYHQPPQHSAQVTFYVTPEEATRIRDAELGEVVAAYRGGFFYQRNNVGTLEIRKWLDQFPRGEPQRLMFRLLRAVRFYSDIEVSHGLPRIHDYVKRRLGYQSGNEGPKDDIFVIGFGGASKSGATYVRMYATDNELTEHNFGFAADVRAKLERDDRNRVRALVYIDDVIGTGTTFQKAVRELYEDCGYLLQERHVKVFATAICGLSAGLEAVRHAGADLGIEIIPYVVDLLTEEDRCFHPKRGIFPNQDELDAAKQLAQEYGSKLAGQRDALGYKDSQLLVVMFDNTPNNTLPILWKPGNKNFPWNPLFKRAGF
jgi:hypothetical protein